MVGRSQGEISDFWYLTLVFAPAKYKQEVSDNHQYMNDGK